MAGPYYVRSTDGSDASDGLTWTNAKATLAGALAVAAAGERIWVSQAHAETQASAMTLTSAGTAAAPVEILCGDDAAEPPTALATTATVTTTGGNGMTLLGFAYVYGITFSAGTTSSNAFINVLTNANGAYVCDCCTLKLGTTSASSVAVISFGILTSSNILMVTRLINSKLVFSNAAQNIFISSKFEMYGGAIGETGTVPTTPIAAGEVPSPGVFRGVDLSAVTSSLVDVSAGSGVVSIEQCKLGAGVALTTGANPGQGGLVVYLDNSDSADTQYRMQRHQYEGDVYSETTLVRTGGASDGATPLSHKMTSSANALFTFPLYGPNLVIYNAATGSSKTAAIEILHDNATALKDDDIWLEVEYLGTSGVPLSLFASDRKTDILATGANQTASSETWTTTGMSNPNKQKLAVTFTPQERGIFRARVVLAKASYTVYVDPLLTVA